jgi:hypothetical protein
MAAPAKNRGWASRGVGLFVFSLIRILLVPFSAGDGGFPWRRRWDRERVVVSVHEYASLASDANHVAT